MFKQFLRIFLLSNNLKLFLKFIARVTVLFYLYYFATLAMPTHLTWVYRSALLCLVLFYLLKAATRRLESSYSLALARDVFTGIFIALTVALHIKFYVMQVFTIEYQSMTPALRPGQLALVDKLTPGLILPWQGPIDAEHHRFLKLRGLRHKDIIIFYSPDRADEKTYIKRIIGLPQDRFSIDESNRVVLNGSRLAEPYLPSHVETAYSKERDRQNAIPPAVRKKGNVAIKIFKKGITGPVTVPEGMYLVLGDNRKSSIDSRHWGFVPAEYIIGRLISAFTLPDWLRK